MARLRTHKTYSDPASGDIVLDDSWDGRGGTFKAGLQYHGMTGQTLIFHRPQNGNIVIDKSGCHSLRRETS